MKTCKTHKTFCVLKSPRSILAHLLHRGKQFLCQVLCGVQYISFSDKICIKRHGNIYVDYTKKLNK